MYQKINEPAKTVTEYEQGKAIPSQAVLAKMERVLGIKLVCYLSSISLALILEWIALSVYSHPTCLYTHTLSLIHFLFLSFSLLSARILMLRYSVERILVHHCKSCKSVYYVTTKLSPPYILFSLPSLPLSPSLPTFRLHSFSLKY